MTDVDRMTDRTDDELRLRAELARTLVPPPTPASLRLAVDAMAAEHLAAPAGARRSWKEALGMGARGFRLAVGAVAMVAVVAVVGLVLLQGRGEGNVAATPFPTLRAVMQPALPDPSGAPAITSSGAWIDAYTAWAMTDASGTLWMTEDGGQTWSERGIVQGDSPPVFLDARNGYAPRTVPSSDAGHAILVSITTDSGQTWLPFQAGTVPDPDGSYPVAEAHFTDPRHGIVLGTTMRLTGDGSSTDETLACAGWATDDGAETWATIPGAPCALGARWGSPTLGVVFTATLSGSVALTLDGGRTWTDGRIPGVADGDRFATAALVPLDDGGARLLVHRPPAGDAGDWMLVAVETHDGGSTWRDAWAVPENPLLIAVTALTTDHLVGLAEGNIIPGNLSTFDSWDGGRTWTRTTDSLLVDTSQTAAWFDRLHGTLYGGWMDCRDRTRDCSASPSTMWLTNDGGRSWHEVPF